MKAVISSELEPERSIDFFLSKIYLFSLITALWLLLVYPFFLMFIF